MCILLAYVVRYCFQCISELVYRISCSYIKNLSNQSNIRFYELFTMVLLGVGVPEILVVLLAFGTALFVVLFTAVLISLSFVFL
jgi:hypothetical protein